LGGGRMVLWVPYWKLGIGSEGVIGRLVQGRTQGKRFFLKGWFSLGLGEGIWGNWGFGKGRFGKTPSFGKERPQILGLGENGGGPNLEGTLKEEPRTFPLEGV